MHRKGVVFSKMFVLRSMGKEHPSTLLVEVDVSRNNEGQNANVETSFS